MRRRTSERKTTRARNGNLARPDAYWRASLRAPRESKRSVILPGMEEKKATIAIMGAGNLGTALALALREAGYRIDSIIARGEGKSLTRARRLAKQIGSRATVGVEKVNARILWFCIPDGEIARVAGAMVDKFQGHGKVALHSSGALSSDELAPLRRKGVAVASVHPLMTFVQRSRPTLVGVSFAIEGDPRAVRSARDIVRDLGGEPFPIRKKHKSAYHALGMFASPLLTSLLATTERVASVAGMTGRAARRRMLPILLQTVRNYGMWGAARGFSGPIVRGDVKTVRRHLEVLRTAALPRRVYVALAHAALEYLPAKNRKSLQELLDSANVRP